MPEQLDVAIVGAGPFGFSVAAWLDDRRTRVFGSPMQTWRTLMPPDMLMRSAWEETSLSARGGRGSIDEFIQLYDYTAAAVKAARRAKAPALEAYPLDAELTPSSTSTGYASTFAHAGFKTVARRVPPRPIMRHDRN